jgi:glutamine amidotransferase
MNHVEILDLGINNLKSLASALQGLNRCTVSIIDRATKSSNPSLLVIPGVGSFGTAVDRLNSRGFTELINGYNAESRSIFGICLGMQLLAYSSSESESIPGLGLIPGEVKLLPTSETTRVPSVGWQDVNISETGQKYFSEFSGQDFYFTHSYYFSPEYAELSFITASHGEMEFSAGVVKENVIGVQFHPEKSSTSGTKFLSRVLDWAHA